MVSAEKALPGRDEPIVTNRNHLFFNEPFDELISAHLEHEGNKASVGEEPSAIQICDNRTDRVALSLVQGSSKSVMVEVSGLEPPTSSLRT